MAEYWVDPENGDDGNAGTLAAPWRLIPGQAGANSVTAGDTINVRNGTTSTLRIFPPANTLTYRGYGMADNALVLNLPSSDLSKTKSVRVVRQGGTHEGMWTIDATSNDANGGAIATGTRTNCVFEDVNIIGPQVNARAACAFASSSENPSGGVTMRRFCITGAAGFGIIAYNKSVTLEDGAIRYTADDNLQLAASTANSSRSGGSDVVRRLEFRDPNRASEGATGDGSSGDCIQLLPTANATWLGSLLVEDCSFYKSTAGKQCMVLHDATNGIKIRRIHIDGGGTGNVQFLIGHIKGSVRITDFYAKDWAVGDNQFARFNPADSSAPAYGMNTGSSVVIKRGVLVGRCPGVYASVDTTGYTFDGAVKIDNVTASGFNDSALSYGSSFGLWSATQANTYGTNYTFKVRNCNLQVSGKPHVILPTGTAGSAKFVVQGNLASDSTYNIGSTVYADLAAFEAAHNQATGNTDADPEASDGLRPLPDSPLLTGGANIGFVRDIEQKQGRKFIGAYCAARLA